MGIRGNRVPIALIVGYASGNNLELEIPHRYSDVAYQQSDRCIMACLNNYEPIVNDYLFFLHPVDILYPGIAPGAEIFAQIVKILSINDVKRHGLSLENILSLENRDKESKIKYWAEIVIFGHQSSQKRGLTSYKKSLVGLQGYKVDLLRLDNFFSLYLLNLLERFPIKIINQLVYTNPYGSNFSRKGHHSLIKKHVSFIFREINHFLIDKTEKGIFETYEPTTTFNFSKYVDKSITDLIVDYVGWLSTCSPLITFLSEIMHYIESILQKAVNFKEQVNYDPKKIDSNIREIIDHILLKKSVHKEDEEAQINQPVFAEFEVELGKSPNQFHRPDFTVPPPDDSLKSHSRANSSSELPKESTTYIDAFTLYEELKKEDEVITAKASRDDLIIVEKEKIQRRINELEREMRNASVNLEFERAARLRDQIFALKRQKSIRSSQVDIRVRPVRDYLIPRERDQQTAISPFMEYWPSVEKMDKHQKTWYEHWRAEALAGNFLRTELSYIFVLVYELLKWENKQEGYTLLKNLWFHYRKSYPTLDSYLINWLADYVILNQCKIDKKEITNELIKRPSRYIKDGLDSLLTTFPPSSFKVMPVEWINWLAKNETQNNPFYQEKRLLMERIIPKIVDIVDAHLRKTTQKGIIESYKPQLNTRFAFERSTHELVETVQYHPFTNYMPLTVFLLNILKLIENKLREYSHFTGLRQELLIKEDIQQIIEKNVMEFLAEHRILEKGNFLEIAEYYKDKSETEAIFVPFSQTQPNYQYMSQKQLKWYFYWRSNIRNGKYIATDFAYIVLHCIEIINEIGISNKEEIYQGLKQLWENYRDSFPMLNSLIPNWIAEFLFINNYPVQELTTFFEQALNTMNHKKYKQTTDKMFELVFTKYLGVPIGQIPPIVIYYLADYLRYPFFKRSKLRQEIDEHVPKILTQIDAHYQEKYMKSFLTYYRTALNYRLPFAYLAYYKSRSRLRVVRYPEYSHRILSELLKQILRLIQNRLREVNYIKRMLKCTLQDKEIYAIVDYYFIDTLGYGHLTPKYPKHVLVSKSGKVIIDREKVEVLTQESDEIEDLLRSDEGDVEPAQVMEKNLITEEESIEDIKIDEQELLETIVDSREAKIALETVDDEWTEFRSRLRNYQLDTLKTILSSNNPKERIKHIAEEAGLMPEAIIEAINEIAFEIIGDIIVDEDYSIIEEYNQDLRELFEEKDP
ncbi:MAG: TerB N-terminal domain-containing protein [Promethearchaeota archaeon]